MYKIMLKKPDDSPEGYVLCNDEGQPVPHQISTSLNSVANDIPTFTVTFRADSGGLQVVQETGEEESSEDVVYAVHVDTKEHIIVKASTALVADEWIIVRGDKDGWITWNGANRCPVPENDVVALKFDDDSICDTLTGDGWVWRHNNHGDLNIIAYRPILEEE